MAGLTSRHQFIKQPAVNPICRVSGRRLPIRTPKLHGGGDVVLAPRYSVSIAGGFNPGNLPLQAWAADLFRQRGANLLKDQPTSSCKPLATPQRDAWPLPFKLVQTSNLIVLLYEMDTVFRQVFLDGRSLRWIHSRRFSVTLWAGGKETRLWSIPADSRTGDGST